MHFRFKALMAIVVVALTACGAPQPPQCKSVPRASRAPATQLIAEARRQWDILSQRDDPHARAAYNAAVAKLFDQLRCPQRPWHEAAASMGTGIAVHGKDDADLSKIDSLFPATLVDTNELGVRHTTAGIGVPLVGWRDQPASGRKRPEFMPPSGEPTIVTALLRFDRGTQPVWHFTAPLQEPEVRIGKRRAALAADWSAAYAFYLEMSRLDKFTLANVILPERFTEETGLYFGQPYDPDRIPVIFVHGLKSSPATFRKMVNQLAGQPWFREKYQAWFFNYPTGNPWLMTAARYRHFMAEAQRYAKQHGDRGNIHKAVIVAHSMGGIVTRASLSDPQNCFYDCYFKEPVEKLKIGPKGHAIIKEGLLYRPLTFPDRVVYLAVPHQGSPMAERFLFTWIARLIRLPKTLTVELLDITLNNAGALVAGDEKEHRLPTSIDTLAPHDPGIKALQKARMNPRIHRHSIIGDRGRGNSPNSSDGIVPYWSAHLSPVESEKIVPSNHSVPRNQEAIDEVQRILELHLHAGRAKANAN